MKKTGINKNVIALRMCAVMVNFATVLNLDKNRIPITAEVVRFAVCCRF